MGNKNLNFRLAGDQVVLLETAANLSSSRRQAKDFDAVFFPIIELGAKTKQDLNLIEGLGETKLSVSLEGLLLIKLFDYVIKWTKWISRP